MKKESTKNLDKKEVKKNIIPEAQNKNPANEKDLLPIITDANKVDNPNNPSPEKIVPIIDSRNATAMELKSFARTTPNFSKITKKDREEYFRDRLAQTLLVIRQKSRSRSKSPQPEEKKITPTFRRTNGIPTEIIEKMNFMGNIFYGKHFQKHYNKTPDVNKVGSDEVIRHLGKYRGEKGEIETYAMFYYYICQNIQFDDKAKEDKSAYCLYLYQAT